MIELEQIPDHKGRILTSRLSDHYSKLYFQSFDRALAPNGFSFFQDTPFHLSLSPRDFLSVLRETPLDTPGVPPSPPTAENCSH